MDNTSEKIRWKLLGSGATGEVPERAVVTFYLDSDSTIDVRLRDNKLIITASDRLEIQPRASNQVCIGSLLNAPG